MKSTRLDMIFQRGYTLLEVVVVVGIVAILVTVISVNVVDSGKQSRDAKRQADLRNLQGAIELYKNKYGRYPEGCRGADQWSGQQGSSYACGGTDTQYIIGHVDVNDFDGDGNTTERFSFAPEFIPVLPRDPKLNGATSGYVYRTNTDGTVYKLMAMNTVEADEGLIPTGANDYSAYLHPMKSCDMKARLNSDNTTSYIGGESLCNSAIRNGIGAYPAGAAITHCRNTDPRFQTSYGAWGGFAPSTGVGAANTVQAWTQLVICQ